MSIKIGYSEQDDAFASGEQVIRNAMNSDISDAPNLVLAFCTNSIDQQLFVDGLSSQLPPETPIVGATTIGIINNDVISYNRPSAAALVLQSKDIRTRITHAELKGGNEHQAGADLATRAGRDKDDRFLFLLYNMIKKARSHRTLPEMNSLNSILHGIRSTEPSPIPIFGGGSIGDYQFSPSRLFSRAGSSSSALLGITFGGSFYYDYTIMHGCTPVDGEYHTITKNDGALILEIDDKPAIEVINDLYGSRDWQRDLPVKELAIGMNLGEKYGSYQESQYVTRLIAGPHLLRKGILTPEPDWHIGTEIQLMIRDTEAMITSTKQNSKMLLEKTLAAGKKPLLGLYIDCAGRTCYFSNSLQEEAAMVQGVFNSHHVPLFGFYSGFEIAPLFGKSRGLEWTGVLILLAEA
ncbi:hypothetical protein EH223_17780 [candidate division KSB1 bacterium]|nr:FIST C-terminal domain-containing protein [candidate division KSB1 bacterium]RQW00599.1 MAG: hypothetical protein EH223_17780 [candidate division KSB1 bacterium]